jgi:molecular chaperone GrpE (heat shock protein)
MIDQLKSKMEELDLKKQEVKPKIDKLNAEREEELLSVNNKYDKLITEINSEVNKFENNVNNDLIDSFINSVMDEFDTKRSMSDYVITDKIKKYRDFIKTVEMFPKELVDRLDKLIDGDPIENIAYDIENIKNKYMK